MMNPDTIAALRPPVEYQDPMVALRTGHEVDDNRATLASVSAES